MLSLVEVESSLQGEGKYTGYPTTFVRLYGCNLNCAYCDSQYAVKSRKRRNASINTIIQAVNRFGNKYICITGGEPLLQEEVYPLIYELTYNGYIVTIETNGSVEIDKDNYSRSFSYCMDIKCPSSGMANRNKFSNLANLQSRDEVKFVISDFTDYVFAKGVIKQYPTNAQIIFSPVFDKEGNHNGKELAEWIQADKLSNVKLGIQLHKILGIY